ncbi:bifunctional diguanylate cyclase/phosphodiesterase [Sphingobium subterraneum]|uniref:Diguanylate cyclase (GGDEF)-like protein n=1 Tax=Sphingobium subterraneum TaxID=627688 RepID=A0A841J420_9SPHN|nr:EAL domain-containing protein [Sphingobium subterraneum]MBB6123335.1 diguanylate cyclase (GGDEF)-like protein [Sphingobium subterraneum]
MAKSGKLKANYFWLLTSLVIGALILSIIAGITLVKHFDTLSATREENVVQNGLRSRVTEVAQMVVPQAIWDDAVKNLDNRFDPEWAKQNIGVFLHQTSGFESTFVLDANNHTVFAAKKAQPITTSDYDRLSKPASHVVSEVRKLETARARETRKSGKTLSDPIQHSAIARLDGNLFIVTATLVQPDFGTSVLRHSRAPIVVTTMPIDLTFLKSFAARYLLTGVKLGGPEDNLESGHAYVVIGDERNEPLAVIAWQPQTPGMDMLQQLGPPTMTMLVLLAAAALTLLRRGRNMAEGLIASEARAAHLAYYDALTGHPNRVLFFDRLGQALNQIRRNENMVAVHAIDLDRFKEINDTFGHHVGDELIFQAAKRLAGTCRVTETFARLSGDEFAIVQTNADVAGAARLAQRLCDAMSQPFDLGSGRVYAGCSIGVTLVGDGQIEPGEALRQADLALYRAKDAGKGQFCFFETEMDNAVRVRRELEDDLREALTRNELFLAYQPQVGRSGAMTGVEALIRWQHPTRGLIAPNFFIPIAEQSGLIMQIGLFALRRAFEDSKRWKDLKVAINVSATQIRLKTFVEEVTALVKELGVNPHQFELEITEGILLGDDIDTQNRLAALRTMGFSLALDDFGTGYSSLSYLQRYPIDKIKIDRSFISNLGVEDEAGALVSAIVKLARAMKLSVIAEGVETDDQLTHLSALGCSDVQGYLFSKPVIANEIDDLYRDRHHAMVHQTVSA